MKKILSSISVIAAVAAVFAACSRQEIATPNNEGNTKTVKLTSAFTETKAAFGNKSGTSYPALWTKNEGSVYVSLNLAKPVESTSVSYNDALTYMNVSATVTDDESGSYTFYAIAPAAGYAGYYSTTKGPEIVIPDTQNPSTSSVDEKAMVLIGWNDTALEELPGEDDDPVAIKFHHVPAYLNLTISGLDDLVGGETVQSISFDSATRLGGKYYFLPGTASDYSDYGAYDKWTDYNSIKVTPADESGKNIWVAFLPILKGTEIMITINGDESTWSYTYTLSADLKSGSVGELTLDASVFAANTTKTYKPDYENALTSNNGDFTIEDATNDDNITIWSFTSSYGAKASAYVSGSRYAVDSYLISPIFDLTEVKKATLSFEWAGNFFNTTPFSDYAKVLVRVVNEDGSYGDWIELDPTYFNGSSWSYTSVSIDLADYVGKKIQIGFEYISGGTDQNTGTLEIKNFKVAVPSEEKGGDDDNYIFYESFNSFSGTGGNDGSWKGNVASTTWSDDNCDNSGWTVGAKSYQASKCAKFGSSSAQGTATTPAITVTSGKTYTLTFKAGAWNGDATTLNLSATNCSLSSESVTITNNAFTDCTVSITDVTSTSITITFTGKQASKARFFLDEVKVTEASE